MNDIWSVEKGQLQKMHRIYLAIDANTFCIAFEFFERFAILRSLVSVTMATDAGK